MEIKDIHAFEVLDSRGRPTICCKMICEGIEVLASVPSGASRGDKEAIELRDEDNRFFGQGVRKAINNIITRIKPAVVYKTFCSQEEFDHFLLDLDGTKNKSNLGANAVLSVSLCFFKALAKKNGLEPWQLCASLLEEEASLPIPLINVINGGAHADNPLDFQEFMIVPFGFDTFSEALRAGVEIFYILKKTLAARGHTVSVGDEGGFAPKLQAPGEVLELLCECVNKSNYVLGKNIGLALDVAASELFKSGRYVFRKSSGESFTSDDLISIYEDLVSRYPIISIEDPFAQEDYDGWRKFYQKFSEKIRVVGDDLVCTNPELIQQAFDNGLFNSVLIKPNQIGTVTETIKAISLGKSYRKRQPIIKTSSIVVSHRSGETEDTFIADLAVGSSADFIKTGSVCRGERTCKYNRLLEIEEFYRLKLKKVEI